ncbi:TetR/AcrR family transcriptional regulator C-terminal domain-containing protein [Kitasatospora sp. MMS16-BH015]|uniref:TetR/AcrR family transcriptional regulator C-terminal domain-containing protein n=1 Tax=Kitasatospora sp. MMS16-BH015 TaxID=2018025 RepID=UPI000CF2B0A5|nr:TetR/AcrR family transcriptional regulator C-terminal domain-containing protein [Kitasatospora sp. MMS16-BH015]
MDPEQLWSPPERPRLGRPPAHSRAEVAAAAVAIADSEGLAAVTMRAVAQRIGAGVMSLYTYVPNKETLVELMIDTVSGDHLPLPEASGDWRADLKALARVQRALMRRHPWLPVALPARQTIGPNALAVTEHVLAALEPTGLDGRAKLEAFSLLTGFVASYTSYELAQERATEAGGRTADEVAAAHARYLTGVLAGGRYPLFARAAAESAAHPAPASPEETFDRLLDRMVTGLMSAAD